MKPGRAGSIDARAAVDPSLVRGVELLSLDAGNTILFFDHARLARLCESYAVAVTAAAVNRAEGEAKVLEEQGALVHPAWSGGSAPSTRSWGAFIGTMMSRAGVPDDRLVGVLEAAWREHRRRNFWCLVPDGLVEALDRLRAAGVRIAVVSNSEGELEPFLRALGIAQVVDAVVDSGVLGVQKPDPRIFRAALDRFGVAAGRALHLGDIYATDVVGARSAGLRVALIDPFGHLAGRHPDVPRVPGAVEVATALAAARSA